MDAALPAPPPLLGDSIDEYVIPLSEPPQAFSHVNAPLEPPLGIDVDANLIELDPIAPAPHSEAPHASSIPPELLPEPIPVEMDPEGPPNGPAPALEGNPDLDWEFVPEADPDPDPPTWPQTHPTVTIPPSPDAPPEAPIFLSLPVPLESASYSPPTVSVPSPFDVPPPVDAPQSAFLSDASQPASLVEPQYPYDSVEDLERRRARLRALDAEFQGRQPAHLPDPMDAGTNAPLDDLPLPYDEMEEDVPTSASPRPPTPMARWTRDAQGRLQRPSSLSVLRFSLPDAPIIFDPLLPIAAAPPLPLSPVGEPAALTPVGEPSAQPLVVTTPHLSPVGEGPDGG